MGLTPYSGIKFPDYNLLQMYKKHGVQQGLGIFFFRFFKVVSSLKSLRYIL